MRNGQNTHGSHNNHAKRMRGRNNNTNRKGQSPLTRLFESNGPDVKIRGTASHIAEKYVQLARDAQSSGDPVAAENYYQHAEHYFRLIAAAQEQFRQAQPLFRDNDTRETQFEDGDDDADGEAPFGQREPHAQPQANSYARAEGQPYGGREHRAPRPEAQPYAPRPQPPQAGGPQEGASDIERLPAFVTGGVSPAASSPFGANGANGQAPGPNGSNGSGEYESGSERFPPHRRRRRRHGPRPDAMTQGGGGESDAGGGAPAASEPEGE